ncbi:MAG: TolC family protein [Polyangiaceae bacterium]
MIPSTLLFVTATLTVAAQATPPAAPGGAPKPASSATPDVVGGGASPTAGAPTTPTPSNPTATSVPPGTSSAPVPESPAANRTLTLAQATEAALSYQPLLRQAQAQAAAADARADIARAPLFPQVNASASYSRQTGNFAPRPGAIPSQVAATSTSSFRSSDFWNFGINANQVIYDFGQARGRWHAAEATAEGQRETTRATRLTTILNVRTAYFQARAQKSLVQVSRETLANQERHLEQIKGFVELGARPAIDLAQARTDVANAKVQVISTENAYATAKAQVNQAMGAPQPTDYDVADETLAPLLEEDQALDRLIQVAVAARPELVALSKQIEAQELQVRAIKGAYGPSLGASAGFTEAGRQLDNMVWNWNVGVSINWPIFQGMLVPSQVREAEANLVAIKAQRDGTENQLRLEVEQARLAVRSNKASLAAVEEALVNSRERLRLAEGRYQTGAGSVIELADAQIATASAAAQRVAADYNLASARAQLMKALGRE